MPKIAAPAAPPKPKAAAKPPPQKSYALLSDVQIAGIKERLKLSSDQESYWPAVESALRAVARKIHATRQADPNASGVADRSRRRGSPATEIGGDAAVVPVARRPEAAKCARSPASSAWKRSPRRSEAARGRWAPNSRVGTLVPLAVIEPG